MKKIFLLALVAAFVTGCKEKEVKEAKVVSDMRKESLRGDVKSIKTVKYDALIAENGDITCAAVADDLEHTVKQFNEKGMFSLVERLDTTGTVLATTKYEYDSQGKLTGQRYDSQNGYFQQWKFAYAPDGNIAGEELILGGLDEPLITTYTYENGRLIGKVFDDKKTIYTYDNAGQLISIEESSGSVIEATAHLIYSPSGEFTSREEVRFDSEKGGFVTKFYDAKGLLTKEEAENGAYSYEYNNDGEVTAKTTPTHKIKYQYKYDEKGNWTEKTQISECVNKQSCDNCDKSTPDAKNFVIKRTIEYR